jgi:nicotinamidase/pyrazinamidase
MTPDEVLQPGDALVVVDVQNDFCPSGALPVPDGDAVVPVMNRWIAAAQAKSVPVYASRDWHPRDHLSFKSEGGPWPSHCVQDTKGAAFHPELYLSSDTIVVSKGTRFDKDQYSAFDETGFAEELRRKGVTRIVVGGLAEDVCVHATAMDGRTHGFAVAVIAEGTRAITDDGRQKTESELAGAGASFV